MAASTSPETRAAGGTERFRLLRHLGSQPSTWAAIETLPDGRTRVVVVDRAERMRGGGSSSGSGASAAAAADVDAQMGDWVKGARRLATLEHPNVARVRNVIIGADEVLVASEYIDGVPWTDLVEGDAAVSLEISLRVIVDVLSGLSAVHNLRDAKREPLKLVHGALSPGGVIVGLDGITRVTGVARARAADDAPDVSASAYLAPEVLLGDDTADARADVYSAGVLLWEALSGRALFANAPPSAIVTHVLGGRVPAAAVPSGAAWAEPLVAATARALAADPEKRFASAAAFAAEIRRVAAAKLAPPVRVAGLVRATFGDRIRARREALERGEVRRSEVAPAGPATEDPFESGQRLSAAPTPVPPAPTASTVPPPPLPLAPLRQAERAPPPESATLATSEPVHLDSIEPEPPSLVPVPKPPPLPREAKEAQTREAKHASPAVTPAPAPTPLAAPRDASASALALPVVDEGALIAPAPIAPPKANRRALLFVAAVACPILIGVVLLVVALTRSSAATAPAAAPVASQVPSSVASSAPTEEPAAASATQGAAADPPAPSSAPTETVQPTSTATATPNAPSPPTSTATVPAPLYTAPRNRPRPRYDPQGI